MSGYFWYVYYQGRILNTQRAGQVLRKPQPPRLTNLPFARNDLGRDPSQNPTTSDTQPTSYI